MCGKRLKIFFALSGLFLLLSFSPLPSSCYANIVLTETEAQELMNEIQESKKELTEVQNQLNDVKIIYEEQKKSYNKQLSEAGKENQNLKVVCTVTSSVALSLLVALVIVLVL